MRTALWLVPLACLFWGGCGQDSKSSKPGENPVTAPVDYLGAINKARQSAVKTVGAVSLDQAIKTYYAQENRYPKNLEELVSSGVLPKLPEPPNGMRFDYDPTNGLVKVVPQK